MRKQLAAVFFVLGCLFLGACGGREQEEYWDEPISEEITSIPKVTEEPSTLALGVGNSAAAMLKGGYFVISEEESAVYMADNQYIRKRDRFGSEEQVVYSAEGKVGYLSIGGDYLYYMADVDREVLGRPREDRNIYRICLLAPGEPELVISGVTDFGTGYGIRNSYLYCTVREKISPTKYQYCLRSIDLSSLEVLSNEENTRFFALTDTAVFKVNSDDNLVCLYNGKESIITNVGQSQSFSSLPMYSNKWTFSIDKSNFYYIDTVKYDSPCVMQVSPKEIKVFQDLGTIGADYGTDLYARNGEVFLDVGTIVSKWGNGGTDHYSPDQYVSVDGSGKVYDFSFVEGSELLFIDDDLILYRLGGDVYWANYSMFLITAPGGMHEEWGILIESDNTGVKPLEYPRGMGFSVE